MKLNNISPLYVCLFICALNVMFKTQWCIHQLILDLYEMKTTASLLSLPNHLSKAIPSNSVLCVLSLAYLVFYVCVIIITAYSLSCCIAYQWPVMLLILSYVSLLSLSVFCHITEPVYSLSWYIEPVMLLN